MKLFPPKYRFAVFFIITLLFFLQSINPKPAYAGNDNIDRLEGKDRYETAVAISQKGWNSSEYAVLVRGDDFADGLCAVPLAAKYKAPILMTRSGYLNKVTLDELKRLGVKHLFIAGGTKAVSANVEKTLEQAGITDIRRLEGEDRYETSVQIAQELQNSTVVLATGKDFPDALSISVPAAQLGMPILLTRPDDLPHPAQKYLETASPERTYLIGGETVISGIVEELVPNPQRLGGSNRYQTNIAVIRNFEDGFAFVQLYVADGGGPRGTEFADALAGAVLAAQSDSPLILADNSLPQVTGNYLLPKIDINTRVTGLGGKNAVPLSLLQSIPDLLVTSAGSLELTPLRTQAGETKSITLTYTLGEAFNNGTVEFVLPGSLTALEGQYKVSSNSAAVKFTDTLLKDSGSKVQVSGVKGQAGQKIILTLIDKRIAQAGNYIVKVLADSDGSALVRLESKGTGKAVKLLIVNTSQLGSIQQQLISKNRSYRELKPQGFVIHSTATPGSNAQAIYRYFNSGYRAASAHFVADWSEIVQMIPEGEVAWHAGPSANERYLSVEMCEPQGYNPQQFQKVWDRTVLLVADACVRYGWNVREDVFSHYMISNTYHEVDHTDPIGYLAKYNRTWDQLLQAIEAKIQEIS